MMDDMRSIRLDSCSICALYSLSLCLHAANPAKKNTVEIQEFAKKHLKNSAQVAKSRAVPHFTGKGRKGKSFAFTFVSLFDRTAQQSPLSFKFAEPHCCVVLISLGLKRITALISPCYTAHPEFLKLAANPGLHSWVTGSYFYAHVQNV